MSDFNYRLHRVVGVARKNGPQYTSICPLGYEDKNYHFQPFSKEELKSIFLPHGTIFGGKIPNHLTNELIKFPIIESQPTADSAKDFFCRDYETKITKYDHIPIVNANKQELREAINKGKYNSYYKVDDRIYYITKSDSQKGITRYWPIEDSLFESNRNLCRCDENIYLIRDSINSPYNFGDILSNEEIISFIIEITRLNNVNLQNITTISDELISKLDLPDDIIQFRFKKFNTILHSIILTHKNIVDLASNPILSNVLQKSIKEYEDEYIKTYKNHHQETIKKMDQSKIQRLKEIDEEYELARNTHLSQLESITNEIDKGNTILHEIIDNIKRKEAEIKTLEQKVSYIEEHKGRLIEDFSIIKDVIGCQTLSTQLSLKNHIESVTCNGESILEFGDFCSHLAAHLYKNNYLEDSATEIAQNLSRLFFAKQVILLPNLIIFKSLIDTIGQYKLHSIGVAPNWTSFDDLYYKALGEMIVSARNNPSEIHILLLQNINLSYIPSYMQPINDVLIGISRKLPGDQDIVGIPSNLWIFGTRTWINEEAIPILKAHINEYGCLENKDYLYSEDKSAIAPKDKYITMDFVNIQREEERRYKSYPDTYSD